MTWLHNIFISYITPSGKALEYFSIRKRKKRETTVQKKQVNTIFQYIKIIEKYSLVFLDVVMEISLNFPVNHDLFL